MKSKIKIQSMFAIFAAVTLVTFSLTLADDDEHGEYEEHHGKSEAPIAQNVKGQLPTLSQPIWQEECSPCHELFNPGLLPARSWTKMMNGLEDHFGDDASIDSGSRTEILAFLTKNSADKLQERRAMRINKSIAPSETPLRFTETSYFKHKHDDIKPETFKRKSIGSASHCSACHPNSEKGDFRERFVKIPKI